MPTHVSNQLSDPRVISGLFKEAQFSQRLIEIEVDGLTSFAEIHQINEDSSRSKGGNRTIELRINLPERFEPTLKSLIRFPRFIASFELNLKKIENQTQQYNSILPNIVDLSDRRSKQEPRYALNMNDAVPVVVETSGRHTEGSLLITDVSIGGYGGILKIHESFSISDGSNILGEAKLENASLKIDAKIVRICLMEREGSLVEYGVGLRKDSKENQKNQTPSSERRSEFRVALNRELALSHPLVPNRSVSGTIIESSIAGFSWKPIDADLFKIASPGMILKSLEPKLQVELVGYSGKNLRFNIVSGEESERIKWLKLLSPKFIENLGTSVSQASELIELFCTSGSLAAGYVKAQKGLGKKIASQISNEDPQDGLIHRWVQYSEDGTLKGHVSACRFSDNIWYMGDLAGSLYEGHQVSPDLAPKFLYSLARSLRTCEPTPLIMKFFIEGHPYWEQFTAAMSSQKFNSAVRSWSRLHYERMVSAHKSATADGNIIVSEIKSSSNLEITGILELLKSSERTLAEYLDFNTFTFGSPRLKLSLSEGSSFKRHYLKLEGDVEGLLIINKLKIGSSISRSTDVAWLFPTNSNVISSASLERIMKLANFEGTKRGIEVTGLAIPADRVETTNKDAKKLICSLVHPDAYDFYKEVAWIGKEE
jgi:hypothetical protein